MATKKVKKKAVKKKTVKQIAKAAQPPHSKKKDNYLRYIIPAAIIVALALFISVSPEGYSTTGKSEVGEVTEKGQEIKVDEKGLKYIVDPSKIIGGGPPKDGIPSIDNPSFVSVEEANEWIFENALVLAIEYKGVKRVYPLQIMTWHEIVNDNIAGDPILITYCPLCGSGIAYERKIEGKEVEFGTSGKLYNSNLVMYDRKTDTYWTQIDGVAIVGDLVGEELTEITIDTVEWKEWRDNHPDSEVLSLETGYDRDYTSDKGPYANYFANDFQFFSAIENKDDTGRLRNKEFVYGIEIDGKYKAYPKRDVDREGFLVDQFNGVNIRIDKLEDGRVVVKNIDDNEEIVKEVDFWFAWFTFHPETELYGF